VEHNVRKALEMCAEATKENEFKSWWWKAKLGHCYLKLGLLRDAEQQFRSSIKIQPVINTFLNLCNVYLRMDVPNNALDLMIEASEKFTSEPRFLLGAARIYDMLHDPESAITYYKKVLVLDSSSVEAIACLGAHAFYSDQVSSVSTHTSTSFPYLLVVSQPEMAIRYYRRLLQMGVNNTEVWNNVGLCCFYSSQYDMALGCFDRALSLADDDVMADVWYNIGHVGVSLGDLGLAYQAFKIALSIDATHGEALNNIAVLEMRRQKFEVAKTCLANSCEVSPFIFEPFYNSGTYS